MSFFWESLTWCWYLAFAIALVLFFGGILLLLVRGADKESLIRASAFEFVAAAVLYFPNEIMYEASADSPGLRILEGLFTAVLKTLNLYLGGNYVHVVLAGHPAFAGLYSTLMVLTNILMVLLFGGFLIKLLEGPFQYFKLLFRRKKKVFLFPECNEKTIAIAESIPAGSHTLLFLYEKEAPSADFKERISACGGLYTSGGAKIFSALKKTASLEIFLFGNCEEDNLIRLEQYCEQLRGSKIRRIRIFVEILRMPWSLYDDFLKSHNSGNGEGLVVNFIRAEENFVYNDLLKASIFENAVAEKEGDRTVRKIGVVIAGMNARSLEMFKAVLHLSQMPGYRLRLLALDEDPEGFAKVMREIPELSKCEKEGNALYEYHYVGGVDFASGKPEEALDEFLPDYTFAFVNTGDDIRNIRLALRMQAYQYRRGNRDGYRIQVNVGNASICRYFNASLIERLEIVGQISAVYNYDFITMSDIEKGSMAIHRVRYPKGEPTWTVYCNSEYNRHSVYARTLSFKWKVWLIDAFYGGDYSVTASDRIWKVYEHMRWNVYTRTMGYVLADPKLLAEDGSLDNRTRSIAMVHNDLVDFEELSKDEQEKDALKLTPEIVAILKSI
ncbi:MAG: hypothetical protein IKR61_01715 [Lachnospiraceae bacterium]|nr:hypothetical protein [Lachnospiraceae bacterium]